VTFQRLRVILISFLLAVAGAGGVAAAHTGTGGEWDDGPEDYGPIRGKTYVKDESTHRDYSWSNTTRDASTGSVGVKNVYQEYFLGIWHTIDTSSDLDSGSYAFASQDSPVPSTCRNGRFIGDHFLNGDKLDSTLVNPPRDNADNDPHGTCP
jgi:hypothetical protein